MKLFLIVYTASGLIGAVSEPIPNMEQCTFREQFLTERNVKIRQNC